MTPGAAGGTGGTPDYIRRLVGGYATGTLSEAQRKLLFEAALEDQELFDELGEEQALKNLLEAPGVRQRLLASIEARPETAWWKHPFPWAMGGAAMTVSLGLLGLVFLGPSGSKPKPVEVAQNRPPVTSETPTSQPVTPAQPKVPNEPNVAGAGDGPGDGAAGQPPVPVKKAPLPNEPKTAGPPPASAATGTLAPPPPPELRNEPKQQAEQQKPAAPAPFAAPAPSAAPPGSPTRDGAANGGPGRAPAAQAPAPTARALAAAKVAPIGRFSFEYSIHDGVLRVVPASDGYLLVRATVGPLDRLMLPTAHLIGARPAELRVPDGATSVVVLFSVRPVQEDSTDDLTTRAPTRTELTGTVEDPRPTVTSRLEVRIALSGK